MAISHSGPLQLRRGTSEDEEWLFQLFRNTMQQHIDAAWGWEELLQREGFTTTLPARGFQILHNGKQCLGSYHLSNKADHLLLDMILVEPEWQAQGHGARMMAHIKHTAAEKQLPLRLRVLKTNPALGFHRHLGFIVVTEDRHSVDMVWPDPTTSIDRSQKSTF